MTTFAELAGRVGVGVAVGVEVSLDNFATTSYRYSTHTSLEIFGATAHDARITDVGQVNKGFGQVGLPTITSFSISLANTDGGADWMMTLSDALASKWRVTLALYEGAGASLSYATKVLGTFVVNGFPRRTHNAVAIDLGTGPALLAALSEPPTVTELLGAGIDGSTIKTSWAHTENDETSYNSDWSDFNASVFGTVPMHWDVQTPTTHIPVVFAGANSKVYPLRISRWEPVNRNPATNSYRAYYAVCSTLDTDTATSMTDKWWEFGFGALRTEETDAGQIQIVSKEVKWHAGHFPPLYDATFAQPGFYFETARSNTITKNGRSWRVVLVKLIQTGPNVPFTSSNWQGSRHLKLVMEQLDGVVEGMRWLGLQFDADDDAAFGYAPMLDRIPPFWVRGSNYSSLTLHDVSATHPTAANSFNYPSAKQALYDLFTTYAAGLSASDVEASTFTSDAVQMGPLVLAPRGRSGTAMDRSVLDEAIAGLCVSGRCEVLVTWAGKLKVVPIVPWTAPTAANMGLDDALTATGAYVLSESRFVSITEYHPAAGERWSPYSYLDGRTGKANDAQQAGVVYDAPQDEGLFYSYLEPSTMTDTPRPVFEITFAGFEIVANCELGDLVVLQWNRGSLGTPYVACWVRIDAIDLDIAAGTCGLRCVYWDDIAVAMPFLLDDEDFLELAVGGAGRTLTLTDASAVVTFSSGSLTADGVQAGDTLIVSNSSEDMLTNNVNRALYVASVDSATQLTIDATLSGGLDFNGGFVGLASWTIRAGLANYPDVVSDPTNYPTGSTFYGKTCQTDDTYVESDISTNMIGF